MLPDILEDFLLLRFDLPQSRLSRRGEAELPVFPTQGASITFATLFTLVANPSSGGRGGRLHTVSTQFAKSRTCYDDESY